MKGTKTISLLTGITIGLAFIIISIVLFIAMYPHLETGILSGFLSSIANLFKITAI